MKAVTGNNNDEDKARNILADITTNMKYSKYRPELNRKETWIELCQRNMDMHMKRFGDLGEDFLEEIEDVYANYVIPKKILPSMRSMHFAGKPIDISPNRIYNCSYMPMVGSLLYLVQKICQLMISYASTKRCSFY